MHYVPDVNQPKAPLLIAWKPHPLVIGKKSLKNGIFVPLFVNRLPHVAYKLAAFNQGGKGIVGILAGFHP